MSENLLIKEGQIGRKFSPVDRLRVNNQGGGSSLWRNAEELEMDSLDVTENGLYLALDEELYAYDTITVDVQEASEEEKKTGKTVVGKDPTTGDDHAVGVDEEGNLTEERIPTAIKIVVLPAKRKYLDGENISYSGIHVYLMYGNNQIFTNDSYPTGEIPFDELIFPVTTADGSQSGREYGYDGVNALLFSCREYRDPFYICFDQVFNFDYSEYPQYISTRQEAELYITRYNGGVYFAAPSSTGQVQFALDIGNTWGQGTSVGSGYVGRDEFINSPVDEDLFFQELKNTIPESTKKPVGVSLNSLQPQKITIPVQWIRPQDGETLEDTFEIEVVSESEPTPDPEPDPYSTRYDFEYQGVKYNFNRSDIRGMSYSSGYVLVTYMDTMQTYTVADALKYNLIVRVSSTHTGGNF